MRAEVQRESEVVEAQPHHSCTARAQANDAIRAAARGKGVSKEAAQAAVEAPQAVDRLLRGHEKQLEAKQARLEQVEAARQG